MNELMKTVVNNIGDLKYFPSFLRKVMEVELYWHAMVGHTEPTEEAKMKLTILWHAFWLCYLKQEGRISEIDFMTRRILSTVLDFNQFGRAAPVLYGNFGFWVIKTLAPEVSSEFDPYPPEIKRAYDEIVMEMMHEADTPMGVLRAEDQS